MGLKKLMLNFAKKIIKINLKLSKKTRFWDIILSLPGITDQKKKVMNIFFLKKIMFFTKKIFFQYEKKNFKLFFGMPKEY